MNRRQFIQKGTLATAGLVTSFHIPAFETQSRKVRMGVIGTGWYGMVVTKAALQTGDAEIVAICDVDTEHLKNSANELNSLQGSRPKEFADYREMLDMKGLDAVVIGTPPHWHALQFVAACKKGLHIYCEKPLSYDVEEGKAMVKAAKAAGNIVQIGFQRRQSAAFQKARQMVEDGTMGKIYQIDAQIHHVPGHRDTTIQVPPASLDWDAWCGPAPKLPYNPNIAHMSWRLEKEYGNGHLADWGIHHIDIIRTVMNFDLPSLYQSHGSLEVLKDKITTPDTLYSMMMFDKCPVVWQHRLWGPGDLNPQYNNGIFFYGEKGTLYASDDKLVLVSGRNVKQQIMDFPTSDAQKRHVANFVEAVKTKNKALISCPIEDAWKSTTAVQLAMVSYYTNSEVKWDNATQTVIDNKAARQQMARAYRKGYTRPV